MSAWQPIETAKADGEWKVLYFPPETDRRGVERLGTYYKVDTSPNPVPRKATHWMPLPAPPEDST